MDSSTAHVIVRIAPVILMLALGNFIRYRKILTASAVEELKNLVVKIALPAVFFVTFLEMRLEPAYGALFGIVFLICVALFAWGFLMRRFAAPQHEYYPFLMTGFEFGMVGIPLFGGAYGLAAAGYIAIVGLGHEIFIWFVFVTALMARRDGVTGFSDTLRAFITSPLIIAILSAVILNLAGLAPAITQALWGRALLETLSLLGNLLIPVILIIIGYGMGLSTAGIRDALVVLATRAIVLLPIALLTGRVLIRGVLGLGPGFEAAIYTFLLLPPPYIVPLFMHADRHGERTYANNVLSVYTVVSLVLFIVYFMFNPTVPGL